MKIKYRDAKYLCKYDLDTELFESINLNIKDLWPTRNIYVLDTKEGKKVLKIINYDDKKLNFIVKMLNYIEKSYGNIISYHKFKDEKYFINWKNNKYIILNLIEGTECNIYNPNDIVNVTKAISLFHKASKGIGNQLTAMEFKESKLGKLEEEFLKEKNELLHHKVQVEKKVFKNEFDKIFLDNFDYNLNKMNKAIELLKNSNYKKVCNDENSIALCHNDLAYHNILLNNDNVYFIDFDYCGLDLKVIDVHNFLSKILKKQGFDYDVYNNIVSLYRKNIDFTEDEETILKVLLVYPKDFFNIIDSYYLNKKQWTYESYLGKLKEKVSYKKELDNLLNKIL